MDLTNIDGITDEVEPRLRAAKVLLVDASNGLLEWQIATNGAVALIESAEAWLPEPDRPRTWQRTIAEAAALFVAEKPTTVGDGQDAAHPLAPGEFIDAVEGAWMRAHENAFGPCCERHIASGDTVPF